MSTNGHTRFHVGEIPAHATICGLRRLAVTSGKNEEHPGCIRFRCACSNVLEAPERWRGSSVRCPLCGAVRGVPPESDAPLPSGSPAPPSKDRAGRAGGARPAARAEGRRSTVAIGVGVALALASLAAAIALEWDRLFGGRTVEAGAGPQADGGGSAAAHAFEAMRQAARDPGARRAAAANWAGLRSAEERYESAGRTLEDAGRLRAAYEKAVAAAEELPRGARAHLWNNAAWFLVTTPHESLRDPVESLRLARLAVDLSASLDPACLDTLAEAARANGLFEEAVRAAVLARQLDPGSQFFAAREREFRDAAEAARTAPGPDAP